MDLDNVRPDGDKMIGDLPDGNSVTLRPGGGGSDSEMTISFKDPASGKQVKVRYAR